MFSQEWEEVYAAGQHNSIWPWSDLVSAIMRHVNSSKIDTTELNVLELGCGAGANVSLFASLGCNYYGVDGSSSAIEKLKARFKSNSKARFQAMDFTKEVPTGHYDIFVDRSSLTHNSTSAIKNTLKMCRHAASDRSVFIGIDWFSTKHSDYMQGKVAEDIYTKTGASAGQFEGLGAVHFSDPIHLEQLFKETGWKLISLEHKCVEQILPEANGRFAAYNLIARPV